MLWTKQWTRINSNLYFDFPAGTLDSHQKGFFSSIYDQMMITLRVTTDFYFFVSKLS